MIEKNKILESWIMVEHLSEGDIGLNDKAILTLNDLQEQDFYSLFLHKIEKKKWNRRQKGGVVVYFDILNFRKLWTYFMQSMVWKRRMRIFVSETSSVLRCISIRILIFWRI